jgi:hypothetical protein
MTPPSHTRPHLLHRITVGRQGLSKLFSNTDADTAFGSSDLSSAGFGGTRESVWEGLWRDWSVGGLGRQWDRETGVLVG